jgi:hypothetical protein
VKRTDPWVSFSLLLILAWSLPAQPPPDQPGTKVSDLLAAPPLKLAPADDELRKLLKARYNEALAEMQQQAALYQKGRSAFDSFAEAGQRVMQARLELSDTPADKVAVLAQFVELNRTAEAMARARFESARGTEAAIHRARYQRLDAEIQLIRARREANKAKGK